MKAKKILAILVFLVVIFGTLNIISAGWFGEDVEADTFKFAQIDGYTNQSAIDGGVKLSDNQTAQSTITVKKIDKDNYTSIKGLKSPASKLNSISGGKKNIEIPYESIKTVNESNINIIVEKISTKSFPEVSERNLTTLQVSTGLFEKDGSYYMVQVMHNYDENSIDKDIQIIRDISNSISKK